MSDAPSRPRPVHTRESEPYWESAREHRLRIQKCAACDRFIHYPRTLCPTCFGAELVWEPVSGGGLVLTWSVSHRAQHPSFADLVPYPIVVAEMEEGFRMLASVQGIGLDELEPGLPVRVAYQDLEDDFTLPVFEHAGRG